MVGTPWSLDVDGMREWVPFLDVDGVALHLSTSDMDGVEDDGVGGSFRSHMWMECDERWTRRVFSFCSSTEFE